jgi:hypothetical protein
MKIVTINDKSPYLQEVLQLGRANTDTLGFLPEGAFNKYAEDGKVVVALGERDRVIGYLLYGTSTRKEDVL